MVALLSNRRYLIILKDTFSIIKTFRGMLAIIKNVGIFLIFQNISGVYMIFFLYIMYNL